MYKLDKQVDGLSHGLLSMKSHVQIGNMNKEEQTRYQSYCAVSFNNDYSPCFQPLKSTNLHIAANSMLVADKKPCWPIYNGFELFYLMLNKRTWAFGGTVLKGIEHWAAISPGCQTPVKMHFEKHCTPYDTGELSRVVDKIIKHRSPADNNYMTIDRPVEYINLQNPDSHIFMKPLHEKKLVVKSHVDYTKHSSLHWVGEQTAKFDSTNVDHVRDIAQARTVSSHPFVNYININIFRKHRHLTNLISGPEQMKENEVAKHNILDYLITTNHGPFFLAADVELNKAGHAEHLALMKMLPRLANFVPVD